MAMERRIVAKDVAEYTRRASAASRRQSVEPPVGIQPGRFHEFVAALSYYVVEQQRKLHNEVWDEEEVQVSGVAGVLVFSISTIMFIV